MARRMARGIEVTPETLMGDAIRRVGIGGDYLREKDTRTRVRAGEHFVPRIGSRLPFEQWLSEGRTEADAAADAVRAALVGARRAGAAAHRGAAAGARRRLRHRAGGRGVTGPGKRRQTMNARHHPTETREVRP